MPYRDEHAQAARLPRIRRGVLLGLAIALAAPSVATAAYTGTVTGTTATFVGDFAGDALVLTVAGGTLAHNQPGFDSAADFDSSADGVQAIPADAGATLVVSARGGADTVDASGVGPAAIGAVFVDGGAGPDVVTGSGGDDRLVGGAGADALRGGGGADQLVWNDGDGSDVMDGDAGTDLVEVNGAAGAGDAFAIVPGAAAGRVRVDRTNLVPSSLDVSAERLTVNGLGGADAIAGAAGLAPLVALSLHGGAGADVLRGGDGDDRLVGDPGRDAIAGGAGEDALVWNDGDGSDVLDGGDGEDTVEVNGAGAGDAWTLVPNGPRARLDRTNLEPSTLDLAASEIVEVHGRGGDDLFATAAGTEDLIAHLLLHGGAGNDVLAGGASEDVVDGGSGNDVLDGGGGADAVMGGSGNDSLALRDGAPDLGACDTGIDRATTDAPGVDVPAGCERVDAAPGPDTAATAVTIGTRSATATRGRRAATRIRVTCPATEPGGCRGTLTLRTRGRVRAGRVRAVLVLGEASFRLAAGQTRRVTVRLTRGHRRLARRGRIAARAVASSRDLAGNLAQSRRNLTLRLGR